MPLRVARTLLIERESIWPYIVVHMSPRARDPAADIVRLFNGPKEFRGPGKIAERAAPPYDVALHRMVERGLKASDLEGIAHVIGATPGAANDVRRAVVPDSTWKRRKGKTLSPAESDQTARLARITALALDVWHGDLDSVREFLGAPHPELDGVRPVEALRTDAGTRLVEALLDKLRHGLPV